MSEERDQNNRRGQRPMGWPAAVTLITAIVGAAATTLAWAVVPPKQPPSLPSEGVVSTREFGEVKARLAGLEESSRLMRTELRNDIKEVRDMVQQLLKEE